MIPIPESVEDLLREIQSDPHGYDLRNWDERGITEEAVRERYEGRNDFPNVSGHRYFSYIFPKLKAAGVPGEEVAKKILEAKDKNLRIMRKYTEERVLINLKYFLNPIHEKEKEREEEIEFSRKCAHVAYEEYARYCEVLKEPAKSKSWFIEETKRIEKKEKYEA